MVVGSGLLAQAFCSTFEKRRDVCIYAAGVSNSGCVDTSEFNRERNRFLCALESEPDERTFVYFSTCSIFDLEMQNTPYVKHKMSMEELVRTRDNHLIFRLPQVAGITPNPHTLLNYLHARVARSESFNIWRNARRNVIDVSDIVLISGIFIDDPGIRNVVVNIANPYNYSILEIVKAFEAVLNKKAVYVLENRGYNYDIDVRQMLEVLDKSDPLFTRNYLERIIGKYYGNK